MMKEVLRDLQTGPLAVIGLIAFLVAFTLIVIYVIRLPRGAREEAKQIPLEDDQDDLTLREN